MRVLNAAGRLMASPLGVVLFCAAGGFTLWFGMGRLREGVARPGPRGERATGAVTGRGPEARARGNAVDSRSGGARKSSDAAGTISARRRPATVPRTRITRQETEVEEIQAEVESPAPSMEVAADGPGRRPGAKAEEPLQASASDRIAPGDPREKDLAEHQAKEAAAPEDAAAQKTLALWCDEHGLWDAAKAHWEAVLRVQPESDAARRRLGFRLRDHKWVLDAAAAEDVAQKKANAFWERVLRRYHAQMRCRSRGPVPARPEAVAHIEAVGDPRAASALWKVFAADTSHHALIVGVLGRFRTREASQMLAALAVYSRDEKAQATAVAALRGREVADYGERLVALMRNPMRVEERLVPIPGRAPARALLVEGDTENYQFLFSRVEASELDSLVGVYQPRLSVGEIQYIRQFNQNQAAMSRQALDAQVAMAWQMIEKYNQSIRALNDRVARVLSEACGAHLGPDPEDGRRWLATALGTAYQPPNSRPKLTITQIVEPLYSPTFLPLPARC